MSQGTRSALGVQCFPANRLGQLGLDFQVNRTAQPDLASLGFHSAPEVRCCPANRLDPEDPCFLVSRMAQLALDCLGCHLGLEHPGYLEDPERR